MPTAHASVEVELDFVDHGVHVRTSEGRAASFALRDRLSCARFYGDLFAALADVGVAAAIDPRPFDLGDSPPFPADTENDSYDADAVERWWQILRLTDAALARFAAGFDGKTSPTHLFWHSFDLAHARYYSYTAPEPAGPRERPLRPAAAAWEDTGGGSLAILPYDAMRATPDPAATLLDFLESAYAAGAAAAGWDVDRFRPGGSTSDARG